MDKTTGPRLALQSGLINECNPHLNNSVSTGHSFNGQNLEHKFSEDVSQLFEKKFHYQKQELNDGEDNWKLPSPSELFGEYYQLDSLQELKQSLNTVKCKLNDYVIEDWSAHTRRKDPASEIPWRVKNETKAEFVTVAWCKFFECLHRYPLVKRPSLNTLHLCEAPGAFIAALNHYLYSTYEKDEVQWNWLSTTLNPYYEGNPLNKMIIDDRFILYTMDHWLFHEDFTGNIIDRKNIEQLERECTTRLGNEVHLITADGSIDCVETPDCQEEFVAPLHFAEITTALTILADRGSFICKMFTLFEATSVCIMYLLNCVFEKVHVFKPATSKRGNSEVYVICLGYKKHTKYLARTVELMKSKLADCSGNILLLPLFAKACMPNSFLQQHEVCARFFMNLQIQAIESNIYTYEMKSPHNTRRSHQLRTFVCNEFYTRYKVEPIPEQLTILYESQGKIQKGLKTAIYKGSYAEREMLKDTSETNQIFMLHGSVNEVEKSLCGRFGTLLTEAADALALQPLPLKVYTGASITRLHSSLFANVHVLLLRLKVQNIFAIEPMWLDDPKCILDNNLKEIMLDYSYSSDFSQIQRHFFIHILGAILEYKPQTITFSNFPFLTHFSVSLLRYLCLNVFSNLSISTDPTFAVTLTGTANIKQNQEIASLKSLLETNSYVLCIIDIIHLHRNEFYKALTEYNNLLLLKNYKLILNNDNHANP